MLALLIVGFRVTSENSNACIIRRTGSDSRYFYHAQARALRPASTTQMENRGRGVPEVRIRLHIWCCSCDVVGHPVDAVCAAYCRRPPAVGPSICSGEYL